METVCQPSYPLNSENASPFGTFTVYLRCPLSCAVTALPPRTPSTTSDTVMTTAAASPLVPISVPPIRLYASRACARDDDLRSVSLLAEDGDRGARLAVLDPTAGLDPRVVKGAFGHRTLVNFAPRRPRPLPG